MQLVGEILLLLALCSITTPLPSPYYETSARIVNGDPVDISVVPYQATLQRRVSPGWSHMCGAVIISSRTILTAAHCGSNYVTTPSSLRAMVGTRYRLSGGTGYPISEIRVHEGYDTDSLENDLAVMVTSCQIIFSSRVSAVPIAIPNISLPVGAEAIVTGFGTVESDGVSSPELLAARVNIVDQATCARAYVRIAAVTSGMICASGLNPPRDACQGDSGGPLVSNGYLIGIVSWGEGCADEMYPGVYTRVSEYHSWIINNTARID